MTTTQSRETQARQRFARRIEHGHLTRDELWAVAAMVRTVGVRLEEWDGVNAFDARKAVKAIATEYRRLIPEDGA